MSLGYRAKRLFFSVQERRSKGANADDALALLGGTPVRDPRTPWPVWPVFGAKERLALLRCFESGNWWYGPRVQAFEEAYAKYQGGRFCVTCTSGTTALEIAAQAADLGPGDEFIVPAFTFIATATGAMRMGATPVFVDVDDSWCLNPDLVEDAITPRTKAIVPVHFAGRVCDMTRLNAIADKHGLTIIEDAAHAWGSAWEGKGAGTLGKAGCFSFQMFKNLTAGEGGAIVSDDEAFSDRFRSIVNCGREKGQPWYYHPELGTNARLTEFAGALLLAQLDRLEPQSDVRARNARILTDGLQDVEGLTLQRGDDRITRRAWHMFPMRIDEATFGCSRQRFIEACQAEGLPIQETYYPVPVYEQPLFAKDPRYANLHCPVAHDLAHTSACWLGHQLLLGPEEDMHHIVRIVRKVKANAAKL